MYRCDGCEKEIEYQETNFVSLHNVFNKKRRFHYCLDCAIERFPQAEAEISWTRK